METEYVRENANQLNRSAQAMDCEASILSSASARLSWAWLGPQASQYEQDLHTWISNFQNHLSRLQYLALRLTHEVDEWEIVDGCQPFRGIPGLGLLVPGGQSIALSPWMVGNMTPNTDEIGDDTSLDQNGITPEFFIGNEGSLYSWSGGKAGKYGQDQNVFESQLPIYQGALYDAEDSRGNIALFGGSDIGDYGGDFKAGTAEAGLQFGFDEKGKFDAGGYAEFSAAEATGVAVVGGSMLGLAGSGTLKAGSAEAFVGIKDNTLGASIGGSIVSAEGELGLNVAGANVGVKAGIGLGLELGFKIGEKGVEGKLGPFKVGLSLGKAKAV
jgi:hypothetical protein